MRRRPCYFKARGGYTCDLTWPARHATPGTQWWEACIRRDLCRACGAEVRRNYKAKVKRRKELARHHGAT